MAKDIMLLQENSSLEKNENQDIEQEKQHPWEPIPLHIELDIVPTPKNKPEMSKTPSRVIVIDLT